MGIFNNKDLPNKIDETPLINQNFYRDSKPMGARAARPNFTRVELAHVDIPQQIVKEIRAEKFRLFYIMFINSLFLVVGLFFSFVYFLAPIVNEAKLKIPLKYIPHPAFTIALSVFGLIFVMISLVDQVNLKIDLRSYKSDLLMKIEKIPYFLIKNYKNLLIRPIYLNWLATFTYIGPAITIGVFYLIRWVTSNYEQLGTELIIMFCLMGVMFFMQVVTLIQTYARKGRITSYYGYEIIAFDEAKALKKNANRRCFVLFLIMLTLLLFVVMIPYFILRRRRRRGIIPQI